MASEVIERYRFKNPLFVCLLRGGAPFASQLLFNITTQSPAFHPEMDYMTVKTYSNRRASKPPELVMDLAPDTDTKGRTVIVLDDVLDEGGTADFVSNYLLKRGAASVDMVVLVQKQKARGKYIEASLFGFEAPDEWVIGMGMDDHRVQKEAYRWAGHIETTDSN